MSQSPKLIDTNVLVDATDAKRPGHADAVALLERGSRLVMAAQIAREYLVVATRPPRLNGLGLHLADARSNLAEFRRVARLLPEEKPVLPALLSLLAQVECRGKIIHDANLVATMLVHDVSTLVTSNVADFARFGEWIVLLEPALALRTDR